MEKLCLSRIETITSSDLLKITASQLAVLANSIEEKTFDKTLKQIHQISESSPAEVYIRYITKLLLTGSSLVETNIVANPIVDKLIESEFKYLVSNPIYIENFSKILLKSESILINLGLTKFINHFNFNQFEKNLLLLTLDQIPDKELTKESVSILSKEFTSLINFIQLNYSNSQISIDQLSLFFKYFFKSEAFTLSEKLLGFTFLLDLLIEQNSSNLELITSEFLVTLSKMKFQEILSSLEPELIVPDRLVNELLSIQSQDDLNDALSLLLAEILSPGSQNLAKTPGITAFTPQNVPEATAKGSQFGSIIRKLPQQPIWNLVFQNVLNKISNPRISQESLSQLLSALDDTTIDLFLEYQWPIDFKIELYIALRQLNPANGGFDLLRTNYLKPIVNDLSYPNLKNSVLYYSNVTRLELDCISNSTSIQSTEHKNFLHIIFEKDVKTVPELIAIGCSQYSPPSPTIDELLENLVVHLLDGNSTYYPLILKNLHQKGQLFKIVNKLVENRTNLNEQVISFLIANRLVDQFIDGVSITSALTLAASAVKLGWNDLQQYLARQKKDQSFINGLLQFLKIESAIDESKADNQKTTSLKVIYLLIETLSKQDLNKEQFEEFQNVQTQALQAFPRLINFGFGHDEAILANGDLNSFPFDVEQQMKVFYQKMYNHEIEIKDVITMLSELRESENPRDQDVFACMIHSLLDEYRFFPEYPLNALAITSVLFGSMIYFQLIRGTALKIALRYILDSCNESPDSNMFKFAVQALFAFRQRLQEFPNYCAALAEVESLKSQQQIYQIILNVGKNKSDTVAGGDIALNQNQQQILNSNTAAPFESQPKPQSFKSISTQVSFFNNVLQEQPRTEVSQRVLFLVNNLTTDNFASKSQELKTILQPANYHWFATYLVGQRVKTEANNINLYGSLVEVIEDELFSEYVTSVALEEVSDLLNEADSSITERNHLKNIGSWLGRITLAINKPLKHKYLALKDLLVEANDVKKLPLVVPFVCKIIEQTNESEIFKLPNPWTLGIIRVLKELYLHFDLKLNLRFEVEVLCKNLGFEFNDIEPSVIIRKLDVVPSSSAAITQGVSNLKLDSTPQGFPQSTVGSREGPVPLVHENAPLLQQQQQPLLPQQQQQQQQSVVSNQGIPPQLPPQHIPQPPQQQQQPQQFTQLQHAHVSEAIFQQLQGLTVFVTNVTLKRMFVLALTKSIKDILPPAVERAVSISVTAAKSLILKDFASEVDEVKLRNSAHILVRRLAEGLALATCRDPLKENIQTTVHGLLPQFLNVENSPLDELPQAINDNIDLACSFVEKAAMDKAVQEIEEQLLPAVSERRTHLEMRTSDQQPFYSQHLSRHSVGLPDPLSLKQTGVTPQQLSVYESFGKHRTSSPGIVPPQEVQPRVQAQAMAPASSVNGLPPHVPQQSPQVTIEQTFTYIQTLVDNLLRSISEVPQSKLSDLAPETPIKLLINQIFGIAARSLSKEQLLLKIAQFIVNALFTTSESNLCVEVFVFLLEKICTISISTRKDVCWWLVHASDERKFNAKVMLALLKAGLITASDLDGPLSKSISPQNSASIDFAIKLVKDSVSVENTVAFRSDFALTVAVLKEIKDNENVDEFLAYLDKESTQLLDSNDSLSESDRMAYVFTEWVRLLQHEPLNDKLHIVFIHQMVKTGIFRSPESITLFFRNAIEISVSFFKESDPINDVFLSTDALSKLIVKSLVIQQETDMSTINYFKLVISIVSLVFANDHEKSEESFNERPYFRIFSTLLSEWSLVDVEKEGLSEFNTTFYLVLADFFNSYQPLAFPGFAFAWVTLISHRMFLPNIIELNHPKAQGKFVLLLLDLLRFESRYIKQKDVPEVISVIYKGTLRLFLLLLHDYPEILVQYHYQLCCEIPPSFVQLRNIVLSSFPKTISMPDPFTQGLKVDRLPEISESPIVAYNPSNDLKSLKKPIDGYLRIPSNMLLKTILNGLKQATSDEAGIGFNKLNFDTKAINALVLYVGIQAVNDRHPNGQTFNPKSSHFALLSGLMQEGSVEFQYHLIEAISNQLRYPNSHTHWFSYIILHFFGAQSLWNGKKSQVQQIITRVLLERIICNRPHPWGLLITFTELLKNTELAFFDLDFTKASPELESIFGSLLRHISSSSSAKSQQLPQAQAV
ncbi:CCR4-NOT transcription complex subunit 1 [Wickerhamomyces ciferrii]|uniref:CCR4-NOT transcription complex subunit 1 n=1 Tax=Wickerhamomyces ciferrii (strain ATCC 14091 / BCRC 22168 / CBS 111 / JCM 3599 / NBRC 0793 / NRRL Y-1031 F-60-10) TaxID=1206466 RepID=K0KGP2_WICCF|nr:CCR4-NOT transcription complex subunit 1 [Wickerhamomyces ciferrii]CCH44325.1 CCR4-NOT transcription complex subunit 1 [Wickerhamomyces ciferrii]